MNVKKLPRGVYTTEISCPECGWSGSNYNDVNATFHEMIKTEHTERGAKYFHCTCCGCDFRP